MKHKQNTTRLPLAILAIAAQLAGLLSSGAAERDIFGYEAQRTSPDSVTKIVFIGDAGTHGPPGNHEFVAAFVLMARALHDAYPNVHAVVHSSNNWPKDFSHADAIIVGLNHGERAGKDAAIGKATKRGAGFMAVHFWRGSQCRGGRPKLSQLDGRLFRNRVVGESVVGSGI